MDVLLPLAVCCFVLIFYWCFRHPTDSPPGINLIILLIKARASTNPSHITKLLMHNFKIKFGDILSVHVLGSKFIAIFNGYDIIKDAVTKHADEFSSRPASVGMDFFKGKGIILNSGQAWREQRKFVSRYLLKISSSAAQTDKQAQCTVLGIIDKISLHGGHKFEMLPILDEVISNEMSAILLGIKQDPNDPIIDEMKELKNVIGSKTTSVLYLLGGLLEHIPGDPFKFKALRKDMNRVLQLISSKVQQVRKQNIPGFVKDYFDKIESDLEKNINSSFSEIQLLHVLLDVGSAGSGTTTTTLNWLCLYLVLNPEIQERVRSEIDEVVGMNKVPSFRDIENLTYTQAFIWEVLRITHVVAHSAPRSTTRDVEFHGYKFPKGTIVVLHLASVLSDPVEFPNPDQLCPSRFLDDNGTLVKPKKFIPFSVGPRVCPAERFAKNMLILIMSSLVQRYIFKLPEGEPRPTTEGEYTLSHIPVRYMLQATKRDVKETRDSQSNIGLNAL